MKEPSRLVCGCKQHTATGGHTIGEKARVAYSCGYDKPYGRLRPLFMNKLNLPDEVKQAYEAGQRDMRRKLRRK